MRVLCFGLDGADYDLVRDLLAQGRLPTLSRLAREGAFGPLRSTIPAFTPTAWSSFLTGLNPAGHGIFSFSTNPNRGMRKVESAASRGGTPLWRVLGAGGMRSAYITIPFTHPPEPAAGIIVTGFGGPQRPEIVPPEARGAILAAHPDLVAVRHPSGWWRDFPAAARRLAEHVEQIADVCFLALELEPELRLLCVDFMSSDIAGHLGWRRLDPSHPAYDPSDAGDELAQVYEAVDEACGQIIEKAEWLWGEEPTTLILSDHGMKPTHWLFRANHWLEQAGYLRYRPRSEAPAPPEADPTGEPGLRRAEGGEDEAHFAEVDFSATHAYSYGYGGQIYLGETTGAVGDRGLERELAAALADIRHPEIGAPAFDVRHKEELYRGSYYEKAPELVLLPRDERIHVDSSRRRWPEAFERNERGKRRDETSFSGHHALTGILAAAGPGIRVADVPAGSEIVQMAPTLLALLGLSVDADGAPIEAILDPAATPDRRPLEAPTATAVDRPVYTREEEAQLLERIRDLGYE